jgi:dTDP-4-amino-4,6-dideoxygalactose transaminase
MIGAMFFTKDKSRCLVRGDEVIVAAVSWSTTYFPLQQYGLHVKFVDVDRQTLNIDLNKLKNAITDKTRVILAVNLLGTSIDEELDVEDESKRAQETAKLMISKTSKKAKKKGERMTL